jgi:hypothetical protein
MSQIQIYKHLKEQRLIVQESDSKDGAVYFVTDAQFLTSNHNQRSSILFQLKSAGFHAKANQLKNLYITTKN